MKSKICSRVNEPFVLGAFLLAFLFLFLPGGGLTFGCLFVCGWAFCSVFYHSDGLYAYCFSPFDIWV